MSDWVFNRLPDFALIEDEVGEMQTEGIEVHTVKLVMDNGEWVVSIEGNNVDDMQDCGLQFSMRPDGREIVTGSRARF